MERHISLSRRCANALSRLAHGERDIIYDPPPVGRFITELISRTADRINFHFRDTGAPIGRHLFRSGTVPSAKQLAAGSLLRARFLLPVPLGSPNVFPTSVTKSTFDGGETNVARQFHRRWIYRASPKRSYLVRVGILPAKTRQVLAN